MAGPVFCADDARFKCRIDGPTTPEDQPFAKEAIAVCEEWYPKINEILYGPERPLPFKDIPISFAKLEMGAITYRKHTKGQVSTCWMQIDRDHRARRGSFGGMVVHELTHAVQNYPMNVKRPSWIEDAVCEYVRCKYFDKSSLGKLTIDAKGRLHGYTDATPQLSKLQQKGVSIEKKGYQHSYTVASEFLVWLEQEKNPDVVRNLTALLSEGRYTSDFFKQQCGAPLDELWRQFLAHSRQR